MDCGHLLFLFHQLCLIRGFAAYGFCVSDVVLVLAFEVEVSDDFVTVREEGLDKLGL